MAPNMNINYKPSQIELFPTNAADAGELNKPRFLFAHLTLSIESLVILSILGIMLTVFAFAIGVEQGKRMVAQSMDERVAQAWHVEARRIHPVMAAPPVLTAGIKNETVVSAKTNKVVATKPVAQPANPVLVKKTSVVIPPVVTAKTQVVAQPKLAPKVAVSPKATVKTQGGLLTVQLATYKSERYARDEALKWRAKGIQTFLVKSGDFWLVCSGQFKSRQEAQNWTKKLPSSYRAAPLRRL